MMPFSRNLNVVQFLRSLGMMLLLAVCVSLGSASALEPPHVSVARTVGDFKVMHGEVTVDAPTEAVWTVLTNYGNFKNMLPGYTHSSLIRANGNEKIVDLGLKMNLFTPELRYQVRIKEDKAQRLMAIERIAGDFDALIASYKLVPINDIKKQTLLIYDLRIDFGIPVPGVGLLMRSNMKDDLAAIQSYCARKPARSVADAKIPSP
jgi:carbon monoxide dehydrogenase subunit G